jgi:hypothetical protein
MQPCILILTGEKGMMSLSSGPLIQNQFPKHNVSGIRSETFTAVKADKNVLALSAVSAG